MIGEWDTKTGVVVTDFDGAQTDLGPEGQVFLDKCATDLSEKTGLSIPRVRRIADRVQQKMNTHPASFDWNYGGHIVASTVGDPYLRIIPICGAVFDEAGVLLGRSDERNEFQHSLLVKHYAERSTFRPGAADFLAQTGAPVHVVTNNSVTKVEPKIRELFTLFPENESRIEPLILGLRGSAKKQVIDPEFTRLPESIRLPCWHRNALLRRPHYLKVLHAIRKFYRLRWDEMTVVGDNFELDLLLPWSLGARVVLVATPLTPPWEVTFVYGLGRRGLVVTSLNQIPL